MKKILHIVSLVIIGIFFFLLHLKAQDRGPWQVGVFGGVSPTLGNYHGDTAQANLGYVGGVFADYYFAEGNFGVGVDMRAIRHPLWGADSVFFSNGHIATSFNKSKRFQYGGLAIGPTYRFSVSKFSAEAFVKGGLYVRQFPNYQRTITYTTGGGVMSPPVTHSQVIRKTINQSNRHFAWMGVGGLRFNYEITQHLSAFIQGDYFTLIGPKFKGESNDFIIMEHESLVPLTSSTFVEDVNLYYADKAVTRSTFTQAINIVGGIKYTFGRKKEPKAAPATELPVPPVTWKEAAPAQVTQDLVVVVKDKQTGLPLSGVKVVVTGAEGAYVLLTNASGETERLTAIAKGNYQITGKKNGIRATEAAIAAEDFSAVGGLIYRELQHDDPRFTLVGETVECDTEQRLSGINTMLTNATTDRNMSQTSDTEGKFIYQLEQQATYNIVASQAGKYSQTERVSTAGLDRSKTLYVTLKLGVCALEAGANWVVKNILYDFDKSDIRPDAAPVLDNVVNIMQQNPTLRIELSSHTDSRGDDAYNLRLSQRRAEAAVNYLVKQGINRNRVEAKGYGETQLINTCTNGVTCSDEAHQENRRTEIKVLRY
ncbi:OmpA family protein [Parapedobacter lycopersici]|uniref:OmpA family protein n=1 Tax=Parapedobacter lycopersici TaxID=1864939 RepID=UPI00214D16EB|nr:OmpA family protein [Parapedobacter lycopersici]